MKTLIFADVHLKVSPDGEMASARFVEFLRGIDPAVYNRVIVLGDLFDFWFEYRHVIFSGYFQVLRAFAELREAGVELHLICGNHDFWAGRFLRDELAFHIHREEYRTSFNGKQVLCVHGDGINPNDTVYRIYKRFARARLTVALFRMLHPDWAMAIAQWASHNSRTHFGTSDPSQSSETHALREYARDVLARGEADVVLCAHSHYPVMEEYPTPKGKGLYINTGDWTHSGNCVEWDGAEFTMVTRETSQAD